MDKTIVEEKVRKILAEQFGLVHEEVKPTSGLAYDLGADDLDLVEILLEVENEFEMSVSDEDAEAWKTVHDIVEYVAANAPKKAVG
jgi:acyl carrier protein